MRLASISIDLDGIGCYHAIHGLAAPRGPDPCFSQGLPRFLELMDDLGVPATLFAVGRDLVQAEASQGLRDASMAGHEIANHTFSHNYQLIARPADEIGAEIMRAHRAIERVCGDAPVGFRAPGYNTSEAVLDALEAQGYRYDSSIFPSPAYFGLRAAAIGMYSLRGQPSRSLPGDVRQFLARRGSYRPRRGQLHRPGRGDDARGLVELPIAVLPINRLPYIGTSLAMLPGLAGELFSRWIRLSSAPINLELHAIDFVDGQDPGVDAALIARQRDLRIPVATKIERLRRVMRGLVEQREVLRMAALAGRSQE